MNKEYADRIQGKGTVMKNYFELLVRNNFRCGRMYGTRTNMVGYSRRACSIRWSYAVTHTTYVRESLLFPDFFHTYSNPRISTWISSEMR